VAIVEQDADGVLALGFDGGDVDALLAGDGPV
jgi:hypothetical protein